MNNSHWDAKGEESRNGREYAQDIERRLLDPDLCLREMDLAGIEFCVMSQTSPGVQSVVDKREAAVVARDANDYAAGFIRSHPDRFSGFAALPLQDPRSATDELEKSVQRSIPKGTRWRCLNSHNPYLLSRRQFRNVWRVHGPFELSERGLHPEVGVQWEARRHPALALL